MAKAKSMPAPDSDPVAESPAQASGLTKARVLATGPFGVIDTVVELDENSLRQGVACGLVDPNPDAVAYAASLQEKDLSCTT